MSRVVHILSRAVSRLKDAVDAPQRDCEILLGSVLKCHSSDIAKREVLSAEQEALFDTYVRRRLEHEPIAYITGERDFHALPKPLLVDRNVLIPRPETEHVVDAVLEQLPGTASGHVLDVGTGSGAIALAIKYSRPSVELTAVDTCPKALALAEANASRLGLTVNFVQSHLLSHTHVDTRWAAIAANLPYVTTAEMQKLSKEVKYEPALALDGGPDGLVFIKTLVHAVAEKRLLVPKGCLVLEVGYQQAGDVAQLMTMFGYRNVAIDKDYAGHDRVVRGCL